MKKLLYLIPVVVLTILVHPATAQKQGRTDKKLTEKFDRILSEKFTGDGPGCAALVARKGEIIYHKAFGMADLELHVPMRPEMIFRLGSITKQFTAVAILQLEEAGKLSVKDSITKFIPGYPMHGRVITVEHLLTHTSGIKSYTGMKEWTAEVRRRDMPLDTLIAFFRDQPMDFDPGEKWSYSNSGYVLLGKIIEVVSGMPYDRYLDEKIFKPLELKQTAYDTTLKIIRNRAKGYGKGDRGYEHAEYLSMTQPHAAGSLISTVEDLYRWYTDLGSGQIIGRSQLDKAFTPFATNDGKETDYGYGWFIGDLYGSKVIHHGGGINGFLTMGIWVPSEELFVGIFSNCEVLSPDFEAWKMAVAALGRDIDFKAIELDSTALARFTGVYVGSDSSERTITLRDGKLYSQRTGSREFLITPYAPDKFFFPDAMITFEFRSDPGGAVTGLVMTRIGSKPVQCLKTDRKPEVKKEIKVGQQVLEQYVGEYELAPGFTLTMRIDNEKLMTRATGQPEFELFPESETTFFLKVVDAKVTFVRGDNGKINGLVLYQNGVHKATKIR